MENGPKKREDFGSDEEYKDYLENWRIYKAFKQMQDGLNKLKDASKSAFELAEGFRQFNLWFGSTFMNDDNTAPRDEMLGEVVKIPDILLSKMGWKWVEGYNQLNSGAHTYISPNTKTSVMLFLN